jgi:hypothetical protein
MAYPYAFEYSAESGNFAGGWSQGATDTQSKASVVHYRQLANRKIAPYLGAYGWQIDLAPGANNCFVQENTLFDMGSNGTWGLGFGLYVSPDLAMTADDRFSIFHAAGSGAAVTIAVCLRYTAASGYQILAAQNASNATVSAATISLGKWHWVEAYGTLDTGGAGTITLALDGNASNTLPTLTQIAVTDAEFGVIGQDAGTTAGKLIFGPIVFDNARVGNPYPRYSPNRILTSSQHVFVGPGTVSRAEIVSTANNQTLIMYDTDTGNTTAGIPVAQLDAALLDTGTRVISDPLYFQKGCYAVVSGGNATDYAKCRISVARGIEGIHTPIAHSLMQSDSSVIRYAMERRQ